MSASSAATAALAGWPSTASKLPNGSATERGTRIHSGSFWRRMARLLALAPTTCDVVQRVCVCVCVRICRACTVLVSSAATHPNRSRSTHTHVPVAGPTRHPPTPAHL
jgi:hypothetical protein